MSPSLHTSTESFHLSIGASQQVFSIYRNVRNHSNAIVPNPPYAHSDFSKTRTDFMLQHEALKEINPARSKPFSYNSET